MSNFKIENVLIPSSIGFLILGRLCDDLDWFPWDGISSDHIESISIVGLVMSALLILIHRVREEGGLKVVLFDSQIKFMIPWALVVLECVLAFNIFGCYDDPSLVEGIDLTFTGCCQYSIVMLLMNLNYSFMCNERTELPFLIVAEAILFGEIIFSGNLLIRFINNLVEKKKDYSILFISIMIAWQILVMDLIFRAAYEDKNKQNKHQKLQKMIHQHHDICKKHHKTAGESQLAPLQGQVKEITHVVQIADFSAHQLVKERKI